MAERQDRSDDAPEALLQERLGYRFADGALFDCALTHRSFAPPAGESPPPWHNERLEFLGDAVLGVAVSHLLYEQFPLATEGELSLWRAGLVNTGYLSRLAATLGLGPCLRMGRGEERSGGRDKGSILAAALEAVLGAVYLDAGQAVATALVRRLWLPAVTAIDPDRSGKDFKTLLQERLQGAGLGLPDYRLVGVSGADHQRHFEVECVTTGGLSVRASGFSKRNAEREAARLLLVLLSADSPSPVNPGSPCGEQPPAGAPATGAQ